MRRYECNTFSHSYLNNCCRGLVEISKLINNPVYARDANKIFIDACPICLSLKFMWDLLWPTIRVTACRVMPRGRDFRIINLYLPAREKERQRDREGGRGREREARRLSPSAGCSNDPCGDYYSRDLLRDLFARKTRVCLLGNDLFVPLVRMADFDDLVERLRVTVAITYGSRVRKTKDVSLSFPSNQSRDSNASR